MIITMAFPKEFTNTTNHQGICIRQVSKGEETRTFFTLPEYEAWKEVWPRLHDGLPRCDVFFSPPL